MSDNVIRVGRSVRSLKTAPEFDGYTKVVINLNENYAYTAGTDEGRTLTLDNPWATDAMARNILSSIRGFQYQPYSSTGVGLDPAAEIGDGVVINNLYGGIYRKKITFGRNYRADLSAPGDEEINHEFQYVAKKDRKYIRQLASLSAELSIQSDRISATVSKTGGDASSFGWELDESSWTIKASGIDIIKATKDGLEVRGKVFANEGAIGGFLLKDNALSTNSQTFGGTNTRGIYIGPSGIQLGPNFQVDAYGNLTASSGKFTGEVSAGSINYGGSDGYFDGGGISSDSIFGSSLYPGTISTYRVNKAINDSLGYAEDFNLIDMGLKQMSNLDLNDNFSYQNHTISRKYVAVPQADGSHVSIYYLAWG